MLWTGLYSRIDFIARFEDISHWKSSSLWIWNDMKWPQRLKQALHTAHWSELFCRLWPTIEVAVDFWTIYRSPHHPQYSDTYNYFEIVVFVGRVFTICCEIFLNLFGCENLHFSARVANWGIAELDHGTSSCKIWKSNFGAGRQYLTVTKVLLIRSRVDLEFRF